MMPQKGNNMVTYECFKGIADPVRHAILGLLSEESLNVSRLAAHFEISRPAVSRHLRVLRESGLVLEARVGRERTYSLDEPMLEAAAKWLQAIAAGDHGTPRRQASRQPSPSREDGADWRQW